MKLKSFLQFITEANSNPEYDDILDTYNRFGLDGMSQVERDFLKSGGKIGSNIRYNLPENILAAFDQLFSLFEKDEIQYSVEGTWAASFGWMQYVMVEMDTALFKKIISIFSNINNTSDIPFVREYDGEIHIMMIDPSWYSDIRQFGSDSIGVHEWGCFGPDCWIISNASRYYGTEIYAAISNIESSDSLTQIISEITRLLEFMAKKCDIEFKQDRHSKLKIRHEAKKILAGDNLISVHDVLDQLITDLGLQPPIL
jgi:hypothetical protein